MPKRLRLILERFSVTQAAFGGLIGMKHSIVSSWLAGKKSMPQSTAMAIQAALGVRWQWLLNGEGEMLLEDLGQLSPEETELIKTYRKCDQDARKEILDQATFNLGRATRRWDLGEGQPQGGQLGWIKK